ncbi:MFS transporter [Nonomuraea sp. KC401]|uniref:MFS transporter n=1 Tax=unclassified Nonomuraea TaxID=2593643 RepID=UPI0010FDFAB2|nr:MULTISPECIES: MFS transporter [unclassified Nonomuraea]NBE94642.1 MFS transporter [Nonomuraea sp. K271]TLF76167.1 MFS transporter [Nonomuraea sp. KC401]
MKAAGSGRPLWRDADFRRLWAGQTASQLGTQATLVTLPLVAVVALGAGVGELGALRAAEQAPILLCSLLAGAWVDRRRSRDVMVAADLGRAATLAAIPVAYALGVLGMPALFAAAFLVGVLSVYFDVAYQASLVRLVEHDRLAQGNSALEGTRSAAQIGGPALGGALVSLLSAPVAVVASAAFYTLSFLSILRIRRPEPLPGPSGTPASMGRRIAEGLRLVTRDPTLRAVGLSTAAYQFALAALMTVYLVFLARELRLPGAAVGLALAATGPGALAGALLAARLPGRYGFGVVMVSAALLGDAVMLAVPALHGSSPGTLAALMAINFAFGACGQLVNVTMMGVRQAVTPVLMQGRVVATISFAGMGLTPLGSLLGGWLAGQWGLRAGLLVSAAAMALSPLVMLMSPLGRLGRALPTRTARD